MAYTKNTWVDQEGQVRYTETIDDGYKVFTPNYEEVTEMGTPVNALNMNHIEEGIEQSYIYCENMIKALYPVGSIYAGTMATCPIAELFGTWVLIGTSIVTNINELASVRGNGLTMGLSNGSTNYGMAATSVDSHPAKMDIATARYGQNVGYTGGSRTSTKGSLGLTTDATQSGVVANITREQISVNIWQRTA